MIRAALQRMFSPEGRPPPLAAARRFLVLGDLQTTTARFGRLLAARGLLGADGWLLPDVRLVAVGDYFDFADHDEEGAREVGDHGLRILSWLAAHPAEQVRLLLGNHDLCRVDELHGISDERFAAARAAADAVDPADPAHEAEFRSRFPEIPTSDLARRDFRAFHTSQRELVQRLLLDGRLRLAWPVRLGGRDALVTHAGITSRELGLLGRPAIEVASIAAALDAFLARALAVVRPHWEAGRPAPLRLDPLHFGGTSGEEGGGMLYHRPSVRTAGWSRHRHRRFHPSQLPPGLVQIAGHTTHGKCLKELGLEGPVLPPGRLRVLTSIGDGFQYSAGLPYGAGEAVLHMVDGSLHHPQLDPAEAELLELEGW